MRRILLIAGLVVLAALGAAAVGVRAAPLDPSVWHVDPTAMADTGGRPGVRIAPARLYPVSAAELTRRLAAIALAEPRTRILAGDPAAGFVTFVQRSAFLGFPDLISVRATDTEGGSRIVILSRARFGDYDWGVNAKRAARWIAALDAGFPAP